MGTIRYSSNEILQKAKEHSALSHSHTLCNCPDNCASYACVPKLCHCTPTNCGVCSSYACA